MRILLTVLVFCSIFSAPVSGLEWGAKLGGGAVVDPTRWGGHVSIEMPLTEEYPTSLVAFFEVYRRSESDVDLDGDGLTDFAKITGTQMPIGLAFMYKAPFTAEAGTVFFSAGGGLLRVISTIEDIALFGGTTTKRKGSSSDGMITVSGGVYFDVTQSAAIFLQARWFRNFSEASADNEVAIQVGVHFPIGSE